MLTRHEIDCVWYLSERSGAGGEHLVVKGHVLQEGAAAEVFTTATGHLCSVHVSHMGDVLGIAINPPRS